MEKQGIFVISLDFELHWGRVDKISLSEKVMQRLYRTKKVIPENLSLFETNQIHATWATVGMLFNESVEEWQRNKPAHSDDFMRLRSQHYKIGNTKYFKTNQHSEFYFAPDLVKLIINTKGQELATHTYGHYCYADHGSNKDEFKEDLIAAKKIASLSGVELNSLVFPRNQYDENSLRICAEMGISTVRTNPPVWYWHSEFGNSFSRKIFRTVDTYNIFDFSKVYRYDYFLRQNLEEPFCLPASRLYKPWRKENLFFNRLRLDRIKREMTLAARLKAYYHLWWHPENFGDNPVECTKELKEIILHYNKLKSKYGFASFNMKEAADYIKNWNECLY